MDPSDGDNVSGCDPRVRPHLVCPRCRSELDDVPGALVCRACHRRYPVVDGTPWMTLEDSAPLDDRAAAGSMDPSGDVR
ncbi:MAG: Trm112 family protein [Alphaproteobacteria bacterium]|nr:Trm112 family protein [Alphaproteobacteria bacterium]